MSTQPIPEYVSNLETLVTARTEQLRNCLKNYELLRQALEAVTAANTLEDAKRIALNAFDKAALSNTDGFTRH